MAITDISRLVAALAAGQTLNFIKASQTAEGAGTWHSMWKADGTPGPGSTPAGGLAGEIPTDATLGAFPFVNPTSGLFNYLVKLALSGSVVGKVILYDRLWHNSGMSGTQTTVDTTLGAVPSLTRPDANGAGTEVWGEIYTAIGATAATLNIRYTDQDGNVSQVGTYAHPANAESVGQMFPITLAAGDTGVRACTAYHWSVSTGTAGNFGLNIIRRIAEVPITQVNVGTILDFAALGLPRVYDDACIGMMVLCSTTSTGLLQGSMILGAG